MPDMRMIDANALDEALVQEYIMYNDVNTVLTLNGVQVFNAAIDTARSKIGESPTIDAVEVVRCRDCVHAIVFRTGSVSCRYHDWYRISVDPDGYCNHGEKDIDGPTDDGGAE
jgi:hypothetical protein